MADELDNPLFDSVFADIKDNPGAYEPKSLFDQVADDVTRVEKVPTNLAAMKARDANPDQYQQIKDLSEKVGLDTGFVARNMPELRRQQTARDITDIAGKSPELGAWFAGDDNPAAIKVDELRHLSGLQWLAASTVQAFKGGMDQVEFGTLSNKALLGTATPEEIARADEMFNGQQPRTYGADSWLEQSWVGANEQIPNIYNYVKNTLQGGVAGFLGGAAVGGGYAAVAGQLGPQAATPEEIVTVPAAALATGIWTGRAGAVSAAFLTAAEQSAGPAYYEFKNMTDENGERMDDDVARVAAYVVGLGTGGLEVVGGAKLASIIPQGDKVLGMFTKDAVKQALTVPTVRAAIKNFMVNTAEGGATEITTEVAQQAVQIFVGELSKKYSNSTDGTQFEAKSAEEMAGELWDTATQTAQIMTIMAPAISGTRLGSDLQKARRANADKAILDAVAAHGENDELLKRLPKKARSAVEAMTANGPVQTVFVQPEGIRTLFQTAEEVDAFVDAVDIRDEWNEAAALERDVQIPFGAYYEKIVGTPAVERLAPFMKLTADGMTPSQAEEFNLAYTEAAQQLMVEFEAQNASMKQTLTDTELVAEDVKNKVMNAGIVPDQAQQYSQLYAKFFTVMAGKLGISPNELYGRYGFDVQRAIPGGEYKQVSGLDLSLAAIRSGRVPQMRRRVEKSKGRSLLERIRERGGIEDVGGELAAAGLKGRQYIRKATSSDMLGKGDNNFKPDTVTGQLWEEGYFPEFQERPTPDALYGAIREELGGQRRYSAQVQQSAEVVELANLVAFSDMLDEIGIDPGSMTDDEVRAELDARVNSDATTDAMMQQARGSIQLSSGRSVINLFNSANGSTFLHETGHMFLEVFKDVAQQGGADGPLAQDWRDLTAFLGVTDGTIPTEAHEKFARSFETYLYEGNAPTAELAGIFARFRSWLLAVYSSVTQIGAPINDKVRGIMDRMLATEQDIAAVSTGPEFQSVFKDAAAAGMTDAQFAAYQAKAAVAVEDAKREHEAALFAEVARERTAAWREAKAEIREDVTRQYENEPVYRALTYLRTGQWNEYADDGWPLPAPAERLYLDRDAIVSVMGEGALERMPRSVPPIYRVSGGVHPDVLAELYGFQSGHEMLTRMMSMPPMQRAIASEVDIRMKARFGDLMGDMNARLRDAQSSMMNDARGEFIAEELGVFYRAGGMYTQLNRAQVKATAAKIIREKTIPEALKPKIYLAANAKAAQEAERAALKGDWPAAVKAKERQLLNHYMAKEAIDATRDVQSALNYLARFNGRKRPAGIPNDYLDQIEVLISKVDLRKSITLTEAQRQLSMEGFLKEKEDSLGEILNVPEDMRKDGFRKSYKLMTVTELMGLRDAVRSIEHVGRNEGRLISEGKAHDLQMVADELEASISASQGERAPLKTRNPTMLDQAASLGRSLDASLLKIEQVLDWFDNGDPNGPWRRFVWQRIADAQVKDEDMKVKYAGRFMEILQKLDPKRLNEWVTVPGVMRKNGKYAWQRSELLSVLLNMGNASNLDKMLRGEAWTNGEEKTIISYLNREETMAAQEIWDMVNELWPETTAMLNRMSAAVPEKIEAQPVQTPHGVLRGGYYPVIYDPEQSHDVEDRAAAAADKMFENTYLRPDTTAGSTKARTQAYARPFLFSLDGAGQHMISMIHDITHREAIRDVNKILTRTSVRSAIEDRYGKEIYRQFVPWLQSIANDRAPNDGLSAVNSVFRGIRSRATMVGMGFRISTILTQVMGYSSALEIVPVKRMAGAWTDWIRNPFAMGEEVNRLSGEMRHRASNLDRDIRDIIREQTGQKTLLEQARKFAFVGLGYADRAITVPTWMAAYRDHLSRLPTDKEGAIAHADKVIRLTQGSGGAKDLAAITRGRNEAAKLITMFYSYFSAYYNRQRTWGRAAKKAIENGTYSDFPSLLAQQVFLTVIPAVGAKLLVGDGPGDDESYAKWAARQIAMYPLSAVPIVRDAAGTFDKGFGYAFTPAGRAVDEATIQPIKLMGDMIDGEAEAREIAVQFLQTTGYALKIPTGQLSTTVNNVWKGIEQDDFQLRDLVLTRKQ